MTGRRTTLFLSLLAVALNLVGAPLVSAHMASVERLPKSALSGMEHCQGRVSAHKAEQAASSASGHLACCKKGVCGCGCLHAAAISVLAISLPTAAPVPAPAEPIRPVPANTVEDPLRPPIT